MRQLRYTVRQRAVRFVARRIASGMTLAEATSDLGMAGPIGRFIAGLCDQGTARQRARFIRDTEREAQRRRVQS